MKSLFFNSSMPQAGSELIQVLMHQNPDIYASPTSPLLEFLFGARSNMELPEVKSQPTKRLLNFVLAHPKDITRLSQIDHT